MKVTAVLFDLDGTLTKPCLDFDKIRAEIGGITGPILEAMENMTSRQRMRAEEIIRRHERIAAEQSELNPGAKKAYEWLRRRKKRIGVITRNQRMSVAFICRKHGLEFDGIVTREDGPVKPDPFPVLKICDMMQVNPGEAVMVGDFLFDLQSGRRAGTKSVLLCTNKNYSEFVNEADFVIHSMEELPQVIASLEQEEGISSD